MLTLQLLVSRERQTTNIGLKAKQTRFTSNCTCDHVYIYTIAQKIKHFHAFLEFLVHRNYFTEKIKGPL